MKACQLLCTTSLDPSSFRTRPRGPLLEHAALALAVTISKKKILCTRVDFFEFFITILTLLVKSTSSYKYYKFRFIHTTGYNMAVV